MTSTHGLADDDRLRRSAAGRPTRSKGAIFIAGAAIQWLRDGLGLLAQAAGVRGARAQRRRTPLGVYFVPAFVGLGAPYWDPDARGAIVGLTRGVDARPPRARGAGGARLPDPRRRRTPWPATRAPACVTLRVDGGAAANDFLMQFQADSWACRSSVPALVETTALGAA